MFLGLKFTTSRFFGDRKFWLVFLLGSVILPGSFLGIQKNGRICGKMFYGTLCRCESFLTVFTVLKFQHGMFWGLHAISVQGIFLGVNL